MILESALDLNSLVEVVCAHTQSSHKVLHYIHCSIVVNIADGRPKVRYILALDDSKNTQEEVVRAISMTLGTGKIEVVSREDALLNKYLTVRMH